ncbi:hypothetical protein O6H91_05G086900 [Diphasiastrum complanatum]|uniref:Uncharacterized protein n=1 Tax=Diphasiastrum complanatum TaxID=34168 RepID=A0ACC2DQL7_DIPCM|nr:hypothetical protein O6H91_05G086900 [Diphasiastrum complanatum]
MYWKAEKLPSMCRKYSSSKGRITYDQLRKSLEQFGVVYSDEEFEKLLSHVDKAGMGFVQYQNLSRMLKHVDGLERVLTRRLGFDDDKALGHRSSLGQGVQVLVDALHRGKRTWMGCKSQEQIYNLFSGVLKDDLLLNSIREPVSFSYAEQAAALSSTKNQLNFGSFKPGAAFWVTKQASPIHASDSNFSQQACASNEGSSMKQLLSTVAKDVLGQPTANMVNQGSPSQKAPSPKPDDAGQQHQNQDGKDSNTQDYQDCSFRMLNPDNETHSLQQPEKGQPTVPGTTSDMNEPASPNSKLSHAARKFTSQPATSEPIWKQMCAKKLSPPVYKKRLQEERLFAEIKAVQILN